MLRHRGSTLVEVLAASVILAVGLAGSMSGLVYAFNVVVNCGYETAMSHIAASEVERARVWGYSNLPYGSYISATSEGTWVGAFDKNGNGGLGAWVQGASTSYDLNGVEVAANNASAVFTVQTTISDAGAGQVLPTTSGLSYTLGNYAVRTIAVTITCLQPNTPPLTLSSVIVKGGI